VYGADIGQWTAFNEDRSFAEPLLESTSDSPPSVPWSGEYRARAAKNRMAVGAFELLAQCA
jgi:hypothetical protein